MVQTIFGSLFTNIGIVCLCLMGFSLIRRCERKKKKDRSEFSSVRRSASIEVTNFEIDKIQEIESMNFFQDQIGET